MIRQKFNDGWVFHKGSGGALANLLQGEMQGQKLILPHDASIAADRNPQEANGSSSGYFREENCHYTKEFSIPDIRNRTVWLEFEGVYQNAFVYINHSFAGKCPYGYGNFFVDATKFIRSGETNLIKVVVKNGAPSGRWYTGGGIFRDVYLMTADRLHLSPNGVHLRTLSADEDQAVLCMDAVIENRGQGSRSVRLCAVLKDAQGNTAAKASMPVTLGEGSKERYSLKMYADAPKLWDTQSPYLYSYTVTLTEDEKTVDEEHGSFGIRTLELDRKNGLRINKKTVKLRGGCIHHDHGIIGAMQFAHADRERIQKLKAAGYNAVRSAHYPASRSLLEACDCEGMLVMDEYTDVWMTTKTDFDYGMAMTEWWEHDITNMVDKDFNHPCVIMYSIGNEIAETGNAFDCAMGKRLADKIKSLDPDRFTVNCINPMLSVKYRIPEVLREICESGCDEAKEISKALGSGEKEINNLMSDLGSLMKTVVCADSVAEALEEAAGQVDILGYNYAAGRYEKDMQKYPDRILAGSETYPQDLAKNWSMVEKYARIIGDFSWAAWDYLGEAGMGQVSYGKERLPGLYAGYPYKAAYCGDFNLIGDRRPVSYWREIIWGCRKAPYIAVRPPEHFSEEIHKSNWCMTDAVRRWNWEGYEGKPVLVEVYSMADLVVLYQNGKEAGRAHPQKLCQTDTELEKGQTAVSVFELTYEAGELTAIAYADGKEAGRDILCTAKGNYFLQAEADETEIPADGSDICYVDISLRDEKGTLAVHRRDSVSIFLEGCGQIAGFGSADPKSEENYFDRTARLYEGRLRAAVRGSGTKGEIRLRIVSGAEEKTVSIQAI